MVRPSSQVAHVLGGVWHLQKSAKCDRDSKEGEIVSGCVCWEG